MIAATIAAHLKGTAAVSSYVGTRIYQTIARRGAAQRYIVLQQIGGADHLRHQTAIAGKVDHRMQINCYAENPVVAWNIGEEVRLAMDGQFHVTMGGGVHSENIVVAELVDDFADYDEPIDADDIGTFAQKQEWRFWHSESTS